MNAKHDRDIEIASELIRLSTSHESLEKKIDEMCQSMRCCITDRKESHADMWREIHSHGRSIAWLKGIGLGLQAVWLGFLAWLEFK